MKIFYGIASVAAVLLAIFLFFQVHPERWLRNGEAEVTIAEISAAGTTASFAGRKAAPDIPRLNGVEALMSLYPWEHFTVEAKDAIPTGVYELARWANNTAVVNHRRRTFPYATTSALMGMTNYNEYYVLQFPDGTYCLALLDAKLAADIARGKAVTLPISKLSSSHSDARPYLKGIGAEYGASIDNIIYSFDDEWFSSHSFLILIIRLGIIAALLVITAILWVIVSQLMRKKASLFARTGNTRDG